MAPENILISHSSIADADHLLFELLNFFCDAFSNVRLIKIGGLTDGKLFRLHDNISELFDGVFDEAQLGLGKADVSAVLIIVDVLRPDCEKLGVSDRIVRGALNSL